MSWMSAAEKLEPTGSQLLTRAEICEQYPDEWVCLVEVEHETNGMIRSARVVGHGTTPTRSLDHVAVWETHPMVASFFTGETKPAFPRFPRIVMTDVIRELLRDRR
jgi:hypothetical protein